MSIWVVYVYLSLPVVSMILLQMILGFLYAGLAEWCIHKYVLHGIAYKKQSFFKSHFLNHHRNCRKYSFYDPRYDHSFWNWDSRLREVFGVLALLGTHSFCLWFIPVFYYTICVYALLYMICHHYMHLNTAWGRKWFYWHYAHHMIDNQSYFWGVLTPLWDYILGSTKPEKAKTYKKKL